MESITKEKVRQLVGEEEGQIIEVLPKEEYSQQHIAGAINIPLKELTADAAASLDRSKPVIAYCHDFL